MQYAFGVSSYGAVGFDFAVVEMDWCSARNDWGCIIWKYIKQIGSVHRVPDKPVTHSLFNGYLLAKAMMLTTIHVLVIAMFAMSWAQETSFSWWLSSTSLSSLLPGTSLAGEIDPPRADLLPCEDAHTPFQSWGLPLGWQWRSACLDAAVCRSTALCQC